MLGSLHFLREAPVNLHWHLAPWDSSPGPRRWLSKVLQPQHTMFLTLFMPSSSLTCMFVSFQEREGEKDSRVNQATQEALGWMDPKAAQEILAKKDQQVLDWTPKFCSSCCDCDSCALMLPQPCLACLSWGLNKKFGKKMIIFFDSSVRCHLVLLVKYGESCNIET